MLRLQATVLFIHLYDTVTS